MSVSSHLTPEPERRLWLILENIRHLAERTDAALTVLTALAMLELSLSQRSLWGWALWAAAVLGILALSPLGARFKWLDGYAEKRRAYDNLITPEEMMKYTHGELILKLDKYLGGGVTATPYYEDLVGLILQASRTAVRKGRLLWIVSGLTTIGQLSLFSRLR